MRRSKEAVRPLMDWNSYRSTEVPAGPSDNCNGIRRYIFRAFCPVYHAESILSLGDGLLLSPPVASSSSWALFRSIISLYSSLLTLRTLNQGLPAEAATAF